jgi:hypothetical protein
MQALRLLYFEVALHTSYVHWQQRGIGTGLVFGAAKRTEEKHDASQESH